MSIDSRDSRHERPGAPGECSTIRLLDADPDLARFLSAEEHRAADRVALPVRSVAGDDDDVSALIEDARAFGALVLDGILAHRVRIGDHPALRLLGPGDVFCLGGEPATTLLADSRCSAIAATRLALLDANFLIAAHRSPRIVRGLAAGMAEQSERVAAQLAISQLPRVDQRLMAIMWLLSEKWGYVTRAGTVLPLALTHATLGYLIGARRPTVTLALGELAERGRLVKQDDGWLIIEPPPATTRSTRQLDVPQVVRFPPSRSEGGERHSRDQHQPYAAARERATIVREENQRAGERTTEQPFPMALRRSAVAIFEREPDSGESSPPADRITMNNGRRYSHHPGL